MVKPNVGEEGSRAGTALLGARQPSDATTDLAVREFVVCVSSHPFVREIALVDLWEQRTMWTVVTASTPERTKAVLDAAVALLIKFPSVRLDFRILNAERVGEAGVQQLLKAAGAVHLWSRSASLVS